MKKKRIIIGTSITVLLVLLVFIYKLCTTIKVKNSITIEVGCKPPKLNKYVIKNYSRAKNKNITWKKLKLKKGKIYYTGEYFGEFKYRGKTYKVKLKVIDKDKPKIDGVTDIEVYVGEEVDFYKDIKITDNSLDEINKSIEGDYDLSKVGTYELKYVLSDKSGNTKKKSFKLIVKEKEVVKNAEKKTSSKGEVIDGVTYINGILIANKSYSLPSNYNPGDLLDVFKTNYNNMSTSASSEGVNLRIISGFRSYSSQQAIYNRYVERDGVALADRYSARAGHSEHQTGLAADINSLDQSFENTSEGMWLNNNCYKYGFIIRYPKGKEDITGYMFEPWHIRYVGVDVATKLYNGGNWITLEEYLGIDSKY